MAKDGGSVTLAIAPGSFTVDAFDPSIEGVPVITQSGTEIPAGKEEEVRQVAKASGVSLTTRKEGS